MTLTLKECLEKGLLKEVQPDTEKALRSIEQAEHKLGLAKESKKAKIFESAIVSAYTSIFHAARAILYKDGFKERSHYGVYVYIKEKYSDKLERRFITTLNSLRLERHEIMYGLEDAEIKEVEAEDTINICKDFIAAVEKLISG